MGKHGIGISLLIFLIHFHPDIKGFSMANEIEAYPWGSKSTNILQLQYNERLNFAHVNALMATTVCEGGYDRVSYFLGKIMDGISDCTTFSLCNDTLCLYYGPPSLALAHQWKSSFMNITQIQTPCMGKEVRSKNGNWEIPNCTPISTRIGKLGLIPAEKWNKDLASPLSIDNLFKKLDHSEAARISNLQKYNSEIIQRFHNSYCSSNETTTIFIDQLGPLPVGCFSITFYNSTSKINFMLPTQLFVESWTPSSNFCHPVLSTKDESMFFNNTGLLLFNLPDYMFCTPNPITKLPRGAIYINKLDKACQRYLKNSEAHGVFADSLFLSEIWSLNPFLYPLFKLLFQTRNLYESRFNQSYGSFMLFEFNRTSNSLLTFRTKQSNGKQLNWSSDIMEMEQKWMQMVQSIWEGYCTIELLSGDISEPVDADTPSQHDSQTQRFPQFQPTDSGSETDRNMEIDEPTPIGRPDEYVTNENSIYPQPPTMYGGCRLLINEVATINDENEYSFIEHRRVCPRGKRIRTTKLTGYVEIMMEAGETGYQISYSDLSDFDLQSVTESDRRVVNQYFTIGSVEIGSHMQTSDMEAPDYIKSGIPKAVEKTICIALLYIPDYLKKPGRDLIKKLKLPYIGHTIPARLDSERMNIIKHYIQDAVIIGPPCEIADCEFFFDLLQKTTQIDGIHGRLIPQPDTEIREGLKPYHSINRCTTSSFPMQQDSYVPGPPSPNNANSCPVKEKKAPFDLQGSRLQSSAQKLVVNSKSFFDESPPGPLNLVGSSVEKTAKVLGIHENTIRKVLSNWKSDAICTPGVKRPNRKEPVMDRFDGFRVEQAKRIIQNSYKRQVAPLLDNIFQEFLRQVREEEERERLTGAEVVPFKCSLKTFSKFLKKIGFKYGKINNRDVILQRSDIVLKRFEYLKAIRENRRLENPKPLVYTDETWIDPFARTGKAWVPKRCPNYRERSLYSFSKNRCGRGPRVICINAGGEMGFITGAMLTYPVTKAKTCFDYHDNVNSETYLKWLVENLLDNLPPDQPHIIVIDNAPYHSRTDSPKSNDLKQTMYDWIVLNIPTVEQASFKPIKEFRKPELWTKVKSMRATDKYYIVDQLVERRGHTILRLPPYNCDLNPIEFVWKDIKHEVKKQNRDQSVKAAVETAKAVMGAYTSDQWKAHVNHVKKLEDQYWEQDGFYEIFIEEHQRIIIPIGGTNDDDSEDEDDDDDDAANARDENVIMSLVHDEEMLMVNENEEDGCEDEPEQQERCVGPRRVLAFEDPTC